MITLKNVTYKHIINLPFLEIPKGKISIITGKSGSGKTTLLKLLNKMISPDTGHIFYKGQDYETLDAIKLRRKIIMLAQSPYIYEGSVKDNLLVGLQLCGLECNHKPNLPMVHDNDLKSLLETLHVSTDLDKEAALLSGGEKQRIAAARIILMKPEVYLLDEPSASLDKQTELSLLSVIKEDAKKRNKTVVMITHSQEVLDQYGENQINLEK